ncbi:hypothetical protein DAPPUDRAFT_241147 [Daphnia pulex]|uniref:Uncharacterized protein n=1 Tax=Daphnia pulex TaxID=6669 RepID=E9GDI9_DAPPU|nr:hypothetical protein DAPPUDRAFT_241147 [Daphnia pulex]|eukprot:EFX82470.1 hypothetical protein DAPPUDRAFT_241147 [Daphnia pulex]
MNSMMGALRILLRDEKPKKFQATYTTLRSTPASNSESVLPTKPKKHVERSPIAKVKSLVIKKLKHDVSSCSSTPLRNKPASNSESVLPTKPKKHVERSPIAKVKSLEIKELKHGGSSCTPLRNKPASNSKSVLPTKPKKHVERSPIAKVKSLEIKELKHDGSSCSSTPLRNKPASNSESVLPAKAAKPKKYVERSADFGEVKSFETKELKHDGKNGVMWENPEFVSSSSGHGLVLAMFASAYQICPKILSFPPAAKIEQDCRGPQPQCSVGSE